MNDVTPGRYRHFKGNDYEVLLVARDVETEEPVVVYQALYGERGHWVRTLADFTAHVSRDGYDGPRFTPHCLSPDVARTRAAVSGGPAT
ncbi:DUF1653 domain-containing protein [Curtobacterium pusillum]|uniref:DUF1653 domain-containing protein n=1 Tax=Curtobacterium pusillum TaxID=69373 RepID=UPI003825C9F6